MIPTQHLDHPVWRGYNLFYPLFTFSLRLPRSLCIIRSGSIIHPLIILHTLSWTIWINKIKWSIFFAKAEFKVVEVLSIYCIKTLLNWISIVYEVCLRETITDLPWKVPTSVGVESVWLILRIKLVMAIGKEVLVVEIADVGEGRLWTVGWSIL